VEVSGDADIGGGGTLWEKEFDFKVSSAGWFAAPGQYVAGAGFRRNAGDSPGRLHIGGPLVTTDPLASITEVEVYYSRSYTLAATGGASIRTGTINNTTLVATVFSGGQTVDDYTKSGLNISLTNQFVAVFHAASSSFTSPAFPSDFYIEKVILRGIAPSPYSGSTTLPGDGRGDAFYFGYENSGTAKPYTGANGFTINGNYPTKPEYNPSHSYTVTHLGDGNQIVFSYADSDGYTDNDWVNLYVRVCGDGAS
jgi:hypothetical protein